MLYAAVGCLVAQGGVTMAPVAQAAQYEATVQFTSIVVDETGVRLEGTITNTGTDPVYNAQAALWRDRTPLTTQDKLDTALAADPTSDTGDRIAGAVNVMCSGTATFSPGDTYDFSVSATWDQMGINSDGVYLVGVHVRASSVSWGSPVTIGRGRTLATLANDQSAFTATVVMLTSAPSLLHDDIFIDDHLADELANRLATLLDLARAPGVSWVVDPALIDEVSIMAQGYEVAGTASRSGTTPGTGTAIATSWLASFRTLNYTQGYRLPWGNPDLALGASTGTDLITASQSPDLPMNNLQNLPLVVRADNGQVDDAFLSYIAGLQPDFVLGEAGLCANLPHGVVLDTMATPYPGGPGPDTDTPLQQQQRALAEDAAQPVAIRVITNEDDAALASWATPGWVTPILLGSIQVSDDWASDLSRGTPAGTLSAATLDRLHDAETTAATYDSLIADPAISSPLTAPAIARLASQSWAGDDPAMAYGGSVNQWISDIMSGVSLIATSQVSLTSRTASFPVTVANNMDVPVRIRISTLTVPIPSSPGNLTIPTTDVQTIQPGDKVSLVLSPTVIRDGDVDAIITVTTQDGYALDSSSTVRMHANSSFWLGWVVVGTAAVLFVVGTFLRVRSKSRHDDAVTGADKTEARTTSEPGTEPESETEPGSEQDFEPGTEPSSDPAGRESGVDAVQHPDSRPAGQEVEHV